ncbi:MAG: HPr-rel-A system PqqD family peptide chaperone [Planctomycetes bacterium]|nr:HPr-rel-A system PqqD family peptide chaperone [Planctomycetota bacterium]
MPQVQRAGLTVHELDGEALVYDPASGNTHRLNGSALFIWQQCDGYRNTCQVASRLTDVYDVSPEQALQHVERAFAEFEERDLVAAAGGTEGEDSSP